MSLRGARLAAAPAALPVLCVSLLLLSGCTSGGSASPAGPSPAVSSAPPSPRVSGEPPPRRKGVVDPAMAPYFQCVKEQGVPMKDTPSGIPVADDERATEAQLKAAEEACRRFVPVAPINDETWAEARRMTACMRANGFPDFPDPDPTTARHPIEELGLKGTPEGVTALKKCDGRPQ